MVEPILFFFLGFLAASLASLGLLRAVWGRAVRLTTIRLASRLPLSPAMIAADKDRLRAEHAIESRRLERRVTALADENAAHRGAIAKDQTARRRLEADLLEMKTKLGVLEMREAAAADNVARLMDDLAQKRRALEAAEQAVVDKTRELTRAGRQLGDARLTSDTRKVEAVALETEAHSLRTAVAALEKELQVARGQLASRIELSSDAAALLDRERSRADALEAERIRLASLRADLEERLRKEAAAKAELALTVGRLEGEVGTRDAALREGAAALARAEAAVQGASDRTADNVREVERARAELEQTTRELSQKADLLRAEKNTLEGALDAARSDRLKLQRRVKELERTLNERIESETEENALLRSRLDSLAAEISKWSPAVADDARGLQGATVAPPPLEEDLNEFLLGPARKTEAAALPAVAAPAQARAGGRK